MEKICDVTQVKSILNSQRVEIMTECNSIAQFLKRIIRKIDLKKELPYFNFDGQTIDDGFDINFVCEGDSYQYFQSKDIFVLEGEENEVITKTITAHVVSSKNRVFNVEVKFVFANPIISNRELIVRAGHYFFVECNTIISYAMNDKIFISLRKVLDEDEINQKISEYYLKQRIKIKIMPISHKFEHADSNMIKDLMKKGILNDKLFFKKTANRNHDFVIKEEVTRSNMYLYESKIIFERFGKKARAGLYLVNRSDDVVIVTKSLYTKANQTEMYLGKTEKIFPVKKFKLPIFFYNIAYYKKYWHNNLPRSIKYM